MISEVIKSTQDYLQSMPKSERKKIGQFFTSEEIAKYMANLFDLNILPESVSILDPGAGSGILSAALLDRIETIKTIKKVELVCYENNETVLPILKKNMEILKKKYSFELNYKIKETDYIVSQANDFERTLLLKNDLKNRVCEEKSVNTNMSSQRIIEIEEMTKGVKAGKIYITAFSDFTTYKKFSEDLAWEAEVWLSELPDHMIHLNGDKFMGHREKR